MEDPRYSESTKFLHRAENSIPLGSQTFSKSRIQYPVGVSPLFINKASANKYYPYILPLNERDYQEVVEKGDGSKEDETYERIRFNYIYKNEPTNMDIDELHLFLMKIN